MMESENRSKFSQKLVWLTHRFGLSRLIRDLRKEVQDFGWSIRFEPKAIELDLGEAVVVFRKKSVYAVAIFIRKYIPLLDRIVPQDLEGREVIQFDDGLFFKLRSGDIIELIGLPEISDPLAGYVEKGAPREGDIVLDAGAFCGECSVEFARMVGPSGHVYALEPDPVNRAVLIRNLEKNRVKNVTVLPYALWDLSEKLSFAGRGDAGSAISALHTFKNVTVARLEVEGKTAAAIFEEIGAIPDFIKMDIEGAEVEALESMIPLIAAGNKSCRLAIASYHIREGQRTHDLIAAPLRAAGFQVETGYSQHRTTWAFLDRTES
jgi:FkbM family methyltransferase